MTNQKKKPQNKPKMFIIRKYIMAKNAAEAIKKDTKAPVHDVFIDDDWRKSQVDRLEDAIGFVMRTERDDYEIEE